MKTGIQLISDEYRQQIKNGMTANRDHNVRMGELVAEAICYVKLELALINKIPPAGWVFVGWPWTYKVRIRKDPIRLLVKAGALIAAEIDRLQRTMEGK